MKSGLLPRRRQGSNRCPSGGRSLRRQSFSNPRVGPAFRGLRSYLAGKSASFYICPKPVATVDTRNCCRCKPVPALGFPEPGPKKDLTNSWGGVWSEPEYILPEPGYRRARPTNRWREPRTATIAFWQCGGRARPTSRSRSGPGFCWGRHQATGSWNLSCSRL